ncbi:MAG: hypothetical protein IPM99_15430 [Rubrivivax sp.]|jgi:DNA-binding MarR family transcriptional regulator|nr:hypothetical protein [Rubrivivax sp.]
MTPTALDIGLALGAAQARLSLEVDEALGMLHGIALRDLALLLQLLRSPQGTASRAALSTALGLSSASLVRLCLPLEKTGLIERVPGRVGLRPAGARVAREAMVTASDATDRALGAAGAADRVRLHGLLGVVAARPATACASGVHP